MIIKRSENDADYKVIAELVTAFATGKISKEEFYLRCDLCGFDIEKDAVVLD